MNRNLLTLPLLVIVITGCATSTHFSSIPVDSAAFEMKQEELRSQYPDIDKFDGPYAHGFFSSILDMPPMDELLQVWGAPGSKRASGWNIWHAALGAGIFAGSSFPPGFVIGGATLFSTAHPTSVWTWNKGNYEIKCVVDYPFAFEYKPHLFYWRWYERRQPDPEGNPVLQSNTAPPLSNSKLYLL